MILRGGRGGNIVKIEVNKVEWSALHSDDCGQCEKDAVIRYWEQKTAHSLLKRTNIYILIDVS